MFEDFVNEINAEFKQVNIPKIKLPEDITTGLGLPKIKKSFIGYNKKAKLINMDYFRTKDYLKPEDAKNELIQLIKNHVKNSKDKNVIFWRVLPYIKKINNLETSSETYFGFARLGIS